MTAFADEVRLAGAGRTVATILGEDAHLRDRAARLLTRGGFSIVSSADEAENAQSDGRRLLVVLEAIAAKRLVGIIERHPGASVVVAMPASSTPGALRRALLAGVDGIVLEEQLEATLVPTAHAVVTGQLVVPREMRLRLAPRALSYREKQVLGFAVRGFTNRQIADELVVAESTVKTHLSSAFRKLGTHSRSEAAALIFDPDVRERLGLVRDVDAFGGPFAETLAHSVSRDDDSRL